MTTPRSGAWGAAGRVVAALGMAAACALAGGCSSTATISVTCDPVVNDGNALAIDIIQVSESEILQISQAGNSWFASPMRQALRSRTKTVTVQGGCRDRVTLEWNKRYPNLAIIPEYVAGADATASQMQIKGKDEWKGKKLEIQVHDRFLIVERR